MARSLALGGLLLLTVAFGPAAPARADEDSYTITLKDHSFAPLQLDVPAGKKVMLVVKNLDPTPSEFESTDLNREKVVVGGGTITVFIGPLRPGSYEFFDDFNPGTTHGHIVAK